MTATRRSRRPGSARPISTSDLIGPGGGVDLHVILGCGGRLTLADSISHIVARVDGVVLRCDGHVTYDEEGLGDWKRKSDTRVRIAGDSFETGLTDNQAPRYGPSWAGGREQVHDRVAVYPPRRIVCRA